MALDSATISALFAKALQRHRAGQLNEAETLYRQIFAEDSRHADSLHLLGVVSRQRGRKDIAVELIRQAIGINGKSAPYYNNFGNALRDLGKLDEAVAAYDAAIRLKPDYAEAYGNLGNALGELGRLDAAVAACATAARLKPGSALIHYNLGIALQKQGQLDAAAAAYSAAIRLSPGNADAHWDLGILLYNQSRFDEAFAHARQSLTLKETIEGKLLFAKCLTRQVFDQVPSDVPGLALRALSEPWARPSELAPAAIRLIKQDPAITGILETTAAFDGLSDEQTDSALRHLADNALLICLMQVTVICDAALERLLTACRSALLRAISRGSGASWFDGPVLGFICALARQCFINEYVFAFTDDEHHCVQQLLGSILSAPVNSARDVVLLACHVPLHSLPGAERWLRFPWPEPVGDVLGAQIAEPMLERQIATNIPRLTGFDIGISSDVRTQYEENPFPRWISAAPGFARASVEDYIRSFLPASSFRALDTRSPDILIAGCGTGQHPIETAQSLPQATVLAVDLSLASLGYAARKAQETGLTNLQFGQADLMQLGQIGRQFDIIESVGVIHHLADPEAGLRILASLLRPDGLLRLGLYSERARQGVVAVRTHIAERGYRPVARDIRRCRQELLALKPQDIRRSVASWEDFASVSGCRDLLFHVQEHRLSLPEIGQWLKRLGLSFLGFQASLETMRLFQARFPHPGSATNLDLWDRFEAENPHCFVEMYQFWVQKESGG